MPFVSARRKLCDSLRVARRLCAAASLSLLLLFGSRALQNAVAEGDTRTISLHHMHTDEDITITYKRNGRYDEEALKKLNWFLRDWRKDEATTHGSAPDRPGVGGAARGRRQGADPGRVRLSLAGDQRHAAPPQPRRRASSASTCSARRWTSTFPACRSRSCATSGLRLQRGGVGFYPTSGSPFVHLDTGSVRHWPRMTREQLVRVFPDGRTVHVPTDGQPLAGYALGARRYRASAASSRRGLRSTPRAMPASTSTAMAASETATAAIRSPSCSACGRGRRGRRRRLAAPPHAGAGARRDRARQGAKPPVVAAVERALTSGREASVGARRRKPLARQVQLPPRPTPTPAAMQPVAPRARQAATARRRAVAPTTSSPQRGYWQGQPTARSPRSRRAAPTSAPAARRSARSAETASADPTPSARCRARTRRSRAAELALAYAAQPADPALARGARRRGRRRRGRRDAARPRRREARRDQPAPRSSRRTSSRRPPSRPARARRSVAARRSCCRRACTTS